MAIYVRNKEGVMESYKIVGLKGENGVTPDIQIGTVTTLEPGEKATVVNSGTKENPVFDFGIPKGADGTGGSGTGDGASIDDSTISTKKTWSSSKIENFVLTNDNTVWLDKSGENLSIEHTKEGYLREVEILGNTIQNQDDLSDIKHLGELYVDDDGKPKLDSQGRKQYKIEVKITNANYNLFNLSNVAFGKDIDSTGNLVNKPSDSMCLDYIPVVEGDKIFMSGGQWKKIIAYDENKNYLRRIYDSFNGSGSCVIPKRVSFIRLGCGQYSLEAIKVNKIMFVFGDKQLEYKENYISYENRKSYKTTILTPCQLMKAGNISDRLYWDKNKGRYVVESRIVKAVYPDYQRVWINMSINGSEVCIASNGSEFSRAYGKTLLLNNNKIISCEVLPKSGTGTHINLHMSKEMLVQKGYEFSYEGARKYLIESNATLYLPLVAPELVETNITEELKLPTYINNTYISVSGGIDGGIKAKAPIDGGKVIKTLQRENTEIKATNDKQDELINTTMLATDEMFMMLEPLLAEVINLNERGVSKMVDMYVAMVQRGIKTIDQVPARYREQVKKILDQLEK